MFGIEFMGPLLDIHNAQIERDKREEKEYRQGLLDAGASIFEAESLVLRKREVKAMERRAISASREADAAQSRTWGRR